MKINLKDILGSLGGTISVEDDFEIEEIEIQSRKIIFPHPPRVKITLTNTQDDILVQGTITGEVELACTRCLEFFKWDFVREITETYSKKELNLDENSVLDITQEIYQHLVLSIPMQSICQKDCKGLCPGCGQNMNSGKCDCKQEAIDPRWEKLRQYLEN